MSANKKHLHLASRLWKKTAFQSMLEPGQQESENILDSFQDILHAYTAFEKSALQGIKQLKAIKLNLPALAKIRDELVGSRTRIQKFVAFLFLFRLSKRLRLSVGSSMSSGSSDSCSNVRSSM